MMQTVKVYTCTKDGCERMAQEGIARRSNSSKLLPLQILRKILPVFMAIFVLHIGKLAIPVKQWRKEIRRSNTILMTPVCVYNIAIAYQDMAKFSDSITFLQRYLSMGVRWNATRSGSAIDFRAYG